MKLLKLFVILAIPNLLFSQVNLRNRDQPKSLQFEGSLGYPESMLTVGIPLNASNTFQFSSIQEIFDTTATTHQFFSIENSITVTKQTRITIGMGYLVNLQSGLNFDVAAKVGYRYNISPNGYVGATLFGSIPREIKSEYSFSSQVTLGYYLPRSNTNRGIVKYRNSRPEHSGFALFNSHYSVINYSYTNKAMYPFIIDTRIATDLGYLFQHPQVSDWQSLNVAYGILIDENIELKPTIGLLTQLQSSTNSVGAIIGIDAEIALMNDIFFKLNISQSNKALIRERIQPWVFAGFGVSI